jgi:hypothetical protein
MVNSVTFLDSNAVSYVERDCQNNCEDDDGAQHSQPQIIAEWCHVGIPCRSEGWSRAANKHTYPVEEAENCHSLYATQIVEL